MSMEHDDSLALFSAICVNMLGSKSHIVTSRNGNCYFQHMVGVVSRNGEICVCSYNAVL